MLVESIAECSCNTFDLHYAIIGHEKNKQFFAFFERFYLIQLGLMGVQFEKLKNNFPTDQPIPAKQGQVRGDKNIFKVGLKR